MSNLKNNTTILQDLLEQIRSLPEAGTNLPEMTNAASANDLLINKEMIDGNGNVVIGTMPNNGNISKTIDVLNETSVSIPAGYTSGGNVSVSESFGTEVNEQASLISQIKTVANNLPDAGGSGGTNQPRFFEIHLGCGSMSGLVSFKYINENFNLVMPPRTTSATIIALEGCLFTGSTITVTTSSQNWTKMTLPGSCTCYKFDGDGSMEFEI